MYGSNEGTKLVAMTKDNKTPELINSLVFLFRYILNDSKSGQRLTSEEHDTQSETSTPRWSGGQLAAGTQVIDAQTQLLPGRKSHSASPMFAVTPATFL